LVDTGATGSRTPIAIRTGSNTSVPWSIVENGSTTYNNAGPYGVLGISRLNHSDDTANKIEAGIFFELKNPAGSIREYAGLTGVRYGNTYDGGLHFYVSNSSGERQFAMEIDDETKVGLGTTDNKGGQLTVQAAGEDTTAANAHFALKLPTGSQGVNHHLQRLDTSGHWNVDTYGTIGWRHSMRLWSSQKTFSVYDMINAADGVSAWTDTGTKYYTHLATRSNYNTGAGAIIIDTNVPGDNQSGNANMLSFRVTGFWYDNDRGGAIDAVFGVYAGENGHYNPTVTGTIPDIWRGNMYWGQNASGKLALRLGDYSGTQECEIAVTDFVQGFINVNTDYARDWSTRKVTGATLTRETAIIYRSPTHVVVGGINRTAISTTTNTFDVSATNSFVPYSAYSRFKIDIHVNVNTSDDDGRGNQNPYRYGRIVRRVNGGSWANADMLGISNQGGAASHIDMTPPRVGSTQNTDLFMTQQDRYRTTAKSAVIIDNPPIDPGDTLEYKLVCYNAASAAFIQIGEPHGYGSDDNYNAQPFGFVVTEIPWRE